MDRFETFSLALFNMSRYWNRLAAEEMEKYDLRGPHAIYLVTIWQSREAVTAARLCELCGRDKADVSRAVSLMEQKGLLTREGANYRAVLRLTEAGVAAAQQVSRRAAVAVEQAGRGFSAEARSTFYQVLETITGNLRDLTRDGLPQG